MCARSWAGAALPIAGARSMAVRARAGWFSSVRATLNPTWAIASVASILSAWLNERAASTQTIRMQVGQPLVVKGLGVLRRSGHGVVRAADPLPKGDRAIEDLVRNARDSMKGVLGDSRNGSRP